MALLDELMKRQGGFGSGPVVPQQAPFSLPPGPIGAPAIDPARNRENLTQLAARSSGDNLLLQEAQNAVGEPDIQVAQRRKKPKPNKGLKPSASTKNELQRKLIGITETEATLKDIKENFDPKFFQTIPKAMIAIDEYADKHLSQIPGIGALPIARLDKFEADRLNKYKKANNSARQFFDQYRKLITGSQAGIKELENLEKSILNVNQGPQAFRASTELMTDRMKGLKKAYTRLLLDGFSEKEIQTPGTDGANRLDNMLQQDRQQEEQKQNIKQQIRQQQEPTRTQAPGGFGRLK